jgi:trehalose 6-phosphate phosphatase
MSSIDAIHARLADAAILLDFDGTLAPIVGRPEDALPLPEAPDVLAALGRTARLVAVITGRPASFVHQVLPVPRLEVIGVYGAEAAPPLERGAVAEVMAIADALPAAILEDKRVSIALHVRGIADTTAVDAVEADLRRVAADHELAVFAGKRVFEIARPGPRKGAAVTQLLVRHAPAAALYAGDDLEDTDAFTALEPMRECGEPVVRVAVRGSETPGALLETADLCVDGPEGLLALLAGLAGL